MDITKKFIDDFHSVNKLRVWSLVITIFGDCATLRGGTIAMTELQAITSLLKIEPGALRTAMSRLTKENWLIRNKVGRNSFYKLSEQGLKSFVEPTSRIYARYQEKSDKQFYLGIKEPVYGSDIKLFQKFLKRTGSISVNKNVFFIPKIFCSETYIEEQNVFIIKGSEINVPNWVCNILFPNQIKENLLELIKKYRKLNYANIAEKLEKPHDALIIRILLIHEWRRIILKLPNNPMIFIPPDWPLEDCRLLVKSIYQKVMLLSEEWWNEPLLEKEKRKLFSRFM